MVAILTIAYAEHLSQDQISGMTSGIAAYGNVYPGTGERTFAVEIFRLSKLPRLKVTLTEWERYGFLRWYEGPEISG
jgi:hypothetical protein